MINIRNIFRKTVCLAVLFGILVSSSGCFTLLRAMAENNAEDTVNSFLKSYFESPTSTKFSKYIDDAVRFELDSKQEEFFLFANEDVTYSITDTNLHSDRKKCEITVTFKHVYEVDRLDLGEAGLDEYLEELGYLSSGKEVVEFVLERNRYEEWLITDYDDFEEIFMGPYEDLIITDGGTGPVPDPTDPTDPPVTPTDHSGAYVATSFAEIKAAYIYTTWLDVELDLPLEDNKVPVDLSYALKNVFYFNTPVTATIHAELFDSSDTLILSKDVVLDGNVICTCDFSAGLEGMVQFDPGDYYIVISMDGNTIAKSEFVTVG